MSFELLDEHEQGELVRKWLRENAISIVVGVGLGLVLIFGWQQWKARGVRQAAEASAQYHALTDAVTAKHGEDVAKIAEAIRKDFPKSAYAVLSALREAEVASAKGDLASAESSLAWADQHAGLPSLKSLVTVRLARVKLAQGDAEGSVKLLDSLPKDDFAALGEEVRGDALTKLGRTDAARAAYEDALTHLDPQAPNRLFVQMKLDELPPGAAKSDAPAKEASGS